MWGRERLEAETKSAQTAQEAHTVQVYGDPEFAAEVQMLPQEPEAKIQEISRVSDKYCISIKDIELYIENPQSPNRVLRQKVPFHLNPDSNGNWRATIDGRISKADFMEMWSEISRFKARRQGKPIRQRKPDDPALIYAIFKQRRKAPQISFGAITKMYKDGELPNYNGRIKKTMTTQNLTREYNRYNPEKYL